VSARALCGKVYGASINDVVKPAQKDALTIHHDGGGPLFSRSVIRNTKAFGFASFCGMKDVVKICRSRHIAQICKAVVKFIAVNVINLATRPRTIDVKPCKSVRRVLVVINTYVDVAYIVDRPNFAKSGSNGCSSMRKQASLLVVVKQFTQALCGKIGLSHDALLKLIGQRRVGVSSARPALAL
tara:strand:- start:77 stop:628 length:552 start_codon:yes stop_codon:yes gene_type:complete